MDLSPDVLQKAGGWGLFSLCIPVIVYLAKGWRDESVKHLASWKEIAETVKANSVVTSRWTDSSESRNRALEALVRSQDLASVALTGSTAKLESLATELRDLRQEFSSLKDAVMRDRR